jgi:N-dimethylarginine dimethylaminohydrolase
MGGYGFRSDIKAHHWIAEKFGCRIIPIKETDETLYHLDCSAFVMNAYSVMLCAEIMDRQTVHQIEQFASVIPVNKQDAYAGICNSLKVEDAIYNSSPLKFMRPDDDDYDGQKHKNETLERICRDLGYEIVYLDLSQAELAGAKLSCFCAPLSGSQARY